MLVCNNSKEQIKLYKFDKFVNLIQRKTLEIYPNNATEMWKFTSFEILTKKDTITKDFHGWLINFNRVFKELTRK